MYARHKLLAVIAALLIGALGTQAMLGWVLGVTDAWLAVLAAAALIGVFVIADASLPEDDDAAAAYDRAACAAVAVGAVSAVACLYLPLPWGGLAAAGVIVGLLLAMRSRMYGGG
jgi:hypothetical protein